jgi:hypothetical protein
VKNLTKIPIGKRTDISGDYSNKRFSLSCSSPWREGLRRASWRECCPDHSQFLSPLPPRNRAPLAGVLFASPEAGSVRPQPRLYKNVNSKAVDQWGAGSGKFEPKNRKILQLEKNSYLKHEILKFLSTFVGHFCPSGSGSGSTDPIESGSNPDPDPQPWF